MKKTHAAESPDAYVASLSGWQRRYVEALRSTVMTAAPLREVVKWGHLVYFSNGPVLLIRAEEDRVLLGFWRGQRLRTVEPRLKPGGKYEMATLELLQGTPLERRTVVELAREAVALNAAHGDPRTVLLSGGNPQIAKADGNAPVQAFIAAMPGWKSDIGRRLDALIGANAPGVHKAVKWNSPFYGMRGQGWFAAFHVFTHYVKVTFFKGTSLQPVPPGGKSEEARWVDIHENDMDEAQLAEWIKQAAGIPGWGKS